MTLQAAAPHKRSRWLVLFAIVILASGTVATSVLAAPTFTFVVDDQDANDEPGQKDLTAQSAAFDGATFYSAWKWDDTSWSGKNTGDGCSLFDTDADGNVNYAVCATIGGKTPVLKSVTVYSCSDGRVDRCTNPVLRLTSSSNCTISAETGSFDATDTQSVCNISALATAAGTPAIVGATLLNTCSYPSQEPNSDPSDCVLTVANLDTSVTTLPQGTTTWSATLDDVATLNPSSATGSVVFKLWSDSACSSLVWESAAVTVSGGTATTVGAGTTSGSKTVTGSGSATYYWTTAFTPVGAFNSSGSACGEATTISPASVSGTAG